MPDFAHWLSVHYLNQSPVEKAAKRAARAWNRIQHKPTSITIKRRGSYLAAQTVRLELDDGGRIAETVFGGIAQQGLVIYGIQDHPDETNTDLEKDDRFVENGQEFKIIAILLTLGEIQAYAVAST